MKLNAPCKCLIPLFAAGCISSAHAGVAVDDSASAAGMMTLNKPSIMDKFYMTAGFGGMFTDYSDSVDDGSVSSVRDGDDGTAWSFVLGYKLTENLAVEAGIQMSDDVDYKAVSDGSGESWAAGPVSAEYEMDLYTLGLVYKRPIAPKWTLYAKIAAVYWRTKETFNESGFVSTDTESGWSAQGLFGVEYDIGKEGHFKHRFDLGWMHIGGNDDVDVGSAGYSVVYEF